MAEIAIPSHGARLNGLVYLAAGRGPHPVVVFLHGFPGNERNLDLAQVVRRAGYQAVFVDYRGNWGSGGTFSFANGLEDVQAVLEWVRQPDNARRYQFDTTRVALVGHSFGGWLALLTSAELPKTVCVAAIAPWNIGWDGARFAEHPNEREQNLAYFRNVTDSSGGPIRARAEDLAESMSTNANAWDYLTRATALRDHAVLLVAGSRDTPDEDVAMVQRMAAGVRAAGGRHVSVIGYDDDHGLSSHRLTLADALVAWLRGDCDRSFSR